MMTYTDFMATPTFLIRLVGLEINLDRNRKHRKLTFIPIYYINFTTIIFSTVCQVIYLFADGMKTQLDLSMNLLPIVVVLSGIIKVSTVVLHRRRLFRVLQTLEELFPKAEKQNRDYNTSYYVKTLNAVTIKFVVVVTVSSLLFNFVPLCVSCWEYFMYDKDFVYRYMYNSVLNKHVLSIWSYTLNYMHHMYSSIASVIWIMASDVASFYCGSLACMHFTYIKRSLRDLDPVGDDSELDNLIALHQNILLCCKEINDIFSISYLMNFIISGITICMTGLVLVTEHEIVTLLVFAPFLMSALFESFVICWFGQQLIDTSSSVNYGAYSSRWYDTNPSRKKALLFIMRRSQKSCAFDLAGYALVSHQTFSHLLSASHKFYTLLRAVYRTDNMD